MLAEIIIRHTTELDPSSGAGDIDGDALMVMGATAEGARRSADDQDDVSIRSTIQSVSTIYPEDSVSVRDFYRQRQQNSLMDDQQSGEPSVVSFRSEGGYIYIGPIWGLTLIGTDFFFSIVPYCGASALR